MKAGLIEVKEMFDDTKLKVNVNMTGKEYAEYLKKDKIKLSKTQWTGISYLVASFFAFIFAFSLYDSITRVPSTAPNLFVQALTLANALSWTVLLKWTLIIILPVLAIAWVIHGVQLRLLA